MAVHFTTKFTMKELVELTYTVLSVLVIFTQSSDISITAMLLNFTSFFRRYQYNSYAANIYPLRQYRLNSYAAIHPKGVIKITTTVLIFYIMDYWCNRYATQFAITKTDAVWIASFPHMYASHTFSLEGLKHWQLFVWVLHWLPHSTKLLV